MRLLLSTCLILSLVGCYRFSNNINNLELDCGESGDLSTFRYVRLLFENSLIFSPNALQVTGEDGENLNSMVTSKGCLRIPSNLTKKVIVANPAGNEGLVFFPERLQLGAVSPLLLKSYRYQSINPICKNILATSSASLAWPVDFQGNDALGFQWGLTIKQAGKTLVSVDRVASDEISREQIDISGVADGSYSLEVKARQLFSTDKLESRFTCDLVVDRSAPFVALDKIPSKEGIVQAAPGEAIRILTSGTGSQEVVFACILPIGKTESACKYDQIQGGYVTAPQAGEWTLRLYSKDAAGNQGSIVERQLEIFDSNLVSVVTGYVDQASLAQKSGAAMTAMIATIKAYEKMKTLTSTSEVAAVFRKVKQAVFETFALPVEENILKLQRNAPVEALGMVTRDGEPLYVVQNAKGDHDLLAVSGEIRDTIAWTQIFGVDRTQFRTIYCPTEGILLGYKGKTVVVYKQGTFAKRKEIDLSLALGTYVQITNDCRYALITSPELKTIDIDLTTFESVLKAPPYSFQVEGQVSLNGRDKILYANTNYFLSDNLDGSVVELSVALNIPNIKKAKIARDGGFGVLTSENILHVFSREGKETAVIEQVTFLGRSSLAHELLALVGSNTIQALSTETGSAQAKFGIDGSNFSFLDANKDFVTWMNVGSNVIQIWTRAGKSFDEIYTKGDPVRTVWLSASGYLSVQSNLYIKLFKLNNDLAPRIIPSKQFATGVAFSGAGTHVVFKQQTHVVESSESQLIDWDYANKKAESFDLPTPFPTSLPMPDDPSTVQDTEYFSRDGISYVAATVDRGSVAIYEANNLSTPVDQFKFASRWIIDLAVDPSGTMIAATVQGGVVYLRNLKTGMVGSVNMGSYALTLAFDKTGRVLYATNKFGDLIRYEISEEMTDWGTIEYLLTEKASVWEVGRYLSVSADKERLAVVGNDTKLNIFDKNLKLLDSFELTDSTIKVGQSVSFSPDGSKVYAGSFDGAWVEVDLKTRQQIKVRYTFIPAGVFSLTVNPAGDRLAFVSGGFVQIADLNVDRVYQNICAWLKPRLPYIPDLSAEERSLCSR